MKRLDLIRYLEMQGCRFMREDGNHTVYLNPAARKVTAIPRHREINDNLVRKICKDLELPASK
jgi:mRNA interferase HicA